MFGEELGRAGDHFQQAAVWLSMEGIECYLITVYFMNPFYSHACVGKTREFLLE